MKTLKDDPLFEMREQAARLQIRKLRHWLMTTASAHALSLTWFFEQRDRLRAAR